MKWLALALLLAAAAVVGPLALLLMAASFLSAVACAVLLAFVGAVVLMAKRTRSPRAS